MSLPFIRYLLRALKIDIWVVLAVATAATLLQRSPIRISTTATIVDQFLFYVMLLHATVAGLRTFVDPSGVTVWLQSRGLTQFQQFKARFATGAFVILLVVAWVGLLQAVGIRQAVQQFAGSPWFPMVRWYELTALPGLLLIGLVQYSIVVFFVASVKSRDSLFPMVRIAMVAGASLLPAFMMLFASRMVSTTGAGAIVFIAAIAGIGLLVAAVLWTTREQHLS